MGNKKVYRYGVAISFAMLAGCSVGKSSSNVTALGSEGATQQMQAKISIAVTSGAVTLYTDSNPGTLVLKAGQTYNLNLNVAGAPAGTTYSIKMTKIDSLNGATQTLPITVGDNTITIPSQGDFSWTVQAAAPAYAPATKVYQAQVTCAQPTFTASSLNAAALTVSPGSGTNLYNFSASGVVAGANGMAPYQCAYDPTGTGIVDTSFTDCSQVRSDVYVNYVNQRKVGVIVKDACNSTYAVTGSANLAWSEPAMPGNVFITGQVSAAKGGAVGDSRVDGVSYFATNSGGNNIVQPMYGKGNFNIKALMDYGMASGVKFGVQISVAGLTDNINVQSGTGSISAAKAKISSVIYSTDQAGDSAPQAIYSGSDCSLTNQGAQVKFVSGQPCAGGTSGDNNMATVEVWGHYSCTALSDSGGSINFAGDFDGYYDLVDNCTGGGGGGGGIVPIQL